MESDARGIAVAAQAAQLRKMMRNPKRRL